MVPDIEHHGNAPIGHTWAIMAWWAKQLASIRSSLQSARVSAIRMMAIMILIHLLDHMNADSQVSFPAPKLTRQGQVKKNQNTRSMVRRESM